MSIAFICAWRLFMTISHLAFYTPVCLIAITMFACRNHNASYSWIPCDLVWTCTGTRILPAKSISRLWTTMYTCETCGKALSCMSTLNRHRMEVHAMDIRRYRCALCSSTYKRAHDLKRHMANFHVSSIIFANTLYLFTFILFIRIFVSSQFLRIYR